MKNYKINLSMYKGKVREALSVAIQEKAFELGYQWGFGKETFWLKSPYLFFNKSSIITHLSDVRCFEDRSGTKISAADFLALTTEDVKDAPKEPELKPFDRVLVRDSDSDEWRPSFYYQRDDSGTFMHRVIFDIGYHQCIPYEGNEHLLGTTEDVK